MCFCFSVLVYFVKINHEGKQSVHWTQIKQKKKRKSENLFDRKICTIKLNMKKKLMTTRTEWTVKNEIQFIYLIFGIFFC